jgi:tetratricopeptide (TPR) repeat protein
VVSLAFLGLMVAFKDYRRQLLLYAFLLGMTGSVLLFYNVSRFRVPAVPFFLLFSSMGVYALYHFILSRQEGRFILASMLVVGVLFYLRVPDIQKVRVNDYAMLAGIYYGKGLYDEAVSEYYKALAVDPNYEEAHNNLGAILDRQGKLDGAILEYKKALTINPNFLKALNNLGAAYTKKGDLDEAISLYKRALAIDPNYVFAHDNLSQIYYYKGNYQLAIIHCNKALELGFKVNPKFLELLKPYR